MAFRVLLQNRTQLDDVMSVMDRQTELSVADDLKLTVPIPGGTPGWPVGCPWLPHGVL